MSLRDARSGRDVMRRAAPAFIVAAVSAGVPLDDVRAAERRAAEIGVHVADILVGEGLVSDDALYRALARLLGLRFAADIPPLLGLDNPAAAASAGVVRCRGGARTGIEAVVAPRGRQAGAMIDALTTSGASDRIALTTPARLEQAIRRDAASRVARDAAGALADRSADFCARGRPRKSAPTAATAFGLALMTMPFQWPALADIGVLAIACLFLGVIALRLFATLASFGPVPPRRLLGDAELPVYTVLVPLYREAGMVRQILRALSRLDYPVAKLDIKLLVEEDDRETRRALETRVLPAGMSLLVCPPGRPRTKPRALNIGLAFARGGLVTVFDAEDIPDRGQLRMAASCFAAAGPRLAALQAALVIANGDDGLLPRLFRLEYAALFDVIIPGLVRHRLPIPLGGTSNHFRRAVLNRVGGWDAWNVTEDADLGLRLARLGYEVGALASATAETAPTRLRVWFGQRTRWMKGWMQTALVHGLGAGLGRPGYGPAQRAALVALAAGTVCCALAYLPGLIGIAAWWLAGCPDLTRGDPLLWLAVATGVTVPVLGGVAMVAPILRGARRRRVPVGVLDAALLPFYALLCSLAAWSALLELFSDPARWAKTEHTPLAAPMPATRSSARRRPA